MLIKAGWIFDGNEVVCFDELSGLELARTKAINKNWDYLKIIKARSNIDIPKFNIKNNQLLDIMFFPDGEIKAIINEKAYLIKLEQITIC